MLTLTEVFKAQSKYGVSQNIDFSGDVVSYELYLGNCRRAITDKTPPDYYSWDIRRQNDFTDNIIIGYVRANLMLVEGFIDENDDLDINKFLIIGNINAIAYKEVFPLIMNNKIWTGCRFNKRVNGKNMTFLVPDYYEMSGTELYMDEKGKPYQFINDMELHSTIDRLIYNPNGNTPRMTKVNPLINTRTAGKGYRLSAVDGTAITPDMKPGFDFPCTSVTIRKYAPSMLTFVDFCGAEKPSMTPEMAELLKMLGKANIRLACVGPTSSGKTTLLNAVCWEVDPELRLILIQNPTTLFL